MYNGIGVQTARGTGTSGYVQSNLSALSFSKHKKVYNAEPDITRAEAEVNRKPNAELLDHEYKRRIEIRCAELEDLMEEEGWSTEDIDKKVSEYRKLLFSEFEAGKMKLDDELDLRNSHSRMKIAKDNRDRMRNALGISSDFVEGTSMAGMKKPNEVEESGEDPEIALKKKVMEEMKAEKEQKRLLKGKKSNESSSDSSSDSSTDDSDSSSSSSEESEPEVKPKKSKKSKESPPSKKKERKRKASTSSSASSASEKRHKKKKESDKRRPVERVESDEDDNKAKVQEEIQRLQREEQQRKRTESPPQEKRRRNESNNESSPEYIRPKIASEIYVVEYSDDEDRNKRDNRRERSPDNRSSRRHRDRTPEDRHSRRNRDEKDRRTRNDDVDRRRNRSPDDRDRRRRNDDNGRRRNRSPDDEDRYSRRRQQDSPKRQSDRSHRHRESPKMMEVKQEPDSD